MNSSEMQDSFLLELIIGSIGAVFIIFSFLISDMSARPGDIANNDKVGFYDIRILTPFHILQGSEFIIFSNPDSTRILVKLMPSDVFLVKSIDSKAIDYSLINLPADTIIFKEKHVNGFWINKPPK